MDIRVEASGASCSPALAAQVRRSLRHELMQRSERVDRVDVRIGGRGSDGRGDDMYCVMQVHLSGTSAATVVDMGTDMRSTLERAAERVGRLTAAKLDAVKAAGAANRAA